MSRWQMVSIGLQKSSTRYLNFDSAGISFLLELGVVDVLGVVFLLQLIPIGLLLFDQVTDDTFGSRLLFFAAYKVDETF